MKITVPAVFNYLLAADGEKMKMKIFEIGAWDMYSNNIKTVSHSMTMANIVNVSAAVQNDNQDNWAKFSFSNGQALEWGYIMMYSTYFTLRHELGSIFQKPEYTSVAINRGYITVWYKD